MKISETGRSMVEMLGVLAIMGVLTVSVMLGYRYAMDRILTNSIITGVRARSVIIGQQRVLGQPLNLSEFHPDTEKDLIYGRFEVKAFNNYVYDGEESQAMEVHNIPRRVCENIRMLTFPDETITLVNGSEMGECIIDGEREHTGGLHDGGDYFTAEYHNVVTFIFAGLSEACSVNQDCQEGLCCVRLEEGDRGCLPCESPTDCDQCQEWNGTTCVNKAEGVRCLWTPTRDGCCTAGVCGACPDKCDGNTCDRLCQTCDSATGECVNHPDGTGCGECKRCENKACVPDLTLPGCTPQCTTNTDCGTCEKCENKACVPDLTLPGCTPQCTTNTDCGACEKCENKACVPDMTLPGCTPQCTTNTDCGACEKCENKACVPDMTLPGCTPQCTTNTDCGTCEKCEDKACVPDMTLPGCTPQCTKDDECGSCEKCENKTCVADLGQDGQTCGSEECSVCANGTCQNKMTQRTLCDGAKENCCPLNGKTCEDETNCPTDKCATDADCGAGNTCCSGVCVLAGSGSQCCGGQIVSADLECCGGRIVDKEKGDECCGGKNLCTNGQWCDGKECAGKMTCISNGMMNPHRGDPGYVSVQKCCQTDEDCTTLEKSSDCPFKCEGNECRAHKKGDGPCFNCNTTTGEKEALTTEGYHIGKCLVCRQMTAVDTTSEGCCWNDEMCQNRNNDKCLRCTSQEETIVGACEKKAGYEQCDCVYNKNGEWHSEWITGKCCPPKSQVSYPLCEACCEGNAEASVYFDVATCTWKCGACPNEEECRRCTNAGGTWI